MRGDRRKRIERRMRGDMRKKKELGDKRRGI